MDRPLPAQLDSPVEDMNEIEKRDKCTLWKIKGVCA
jgi:GTP1/Obg family GTP-binding protein